jgi:hypothetical protein
MCFARRRPLESMTVLKVQNDVYSTKMIATKSAYLRIDAEVLRKPRPALDHMLIVCGRPVLVVFGLG